MCMKNYLIGVLATAYFLTVMATSAGEKSLIEVKVDEFARLRNDIQSLIDKHVNDAKQREDAEVDAVCKEIEYTGNAGVLTVGYLILNIEFPLSAKKPPYATEAIGSLARDIRLTPAARVLCAIYGKEGADACIKQLKTATTVGMREYQFWFVIESAYGRESGISELSKSLGEENKVYQDLTKKIRSNSLPPYPLQPPN